MARLGWCHWLMLRNPPLESSRSSLPCRPDLHTKSQQMLIGALRVRVWQRAQLTKRAWGRARAYDEAYDLLVLLTTSPKNHVRWCLSREFGTARRVRLC